jgi:hypothetical protein
MALVRQIVGFYFLETPENCSRVVFHDPRAAKVQIDLPEQDINMATPASKMINFEPKPGMMIFANSWLMHSFTRHAANLPIKFVHFNLTVIHQPQSCAMPAAEGDMNKYAIRFNKSRGMEGRGTMEHCWRVFENGKEYLFKNFQINVPSQSEKEADSEDWNVVCHGVMTIDRETSTAIIN